MLRLRRIVKWISMALFVILFLFAIAVYTHWGLPPIKCEASGKNMIVHLETLADYPTSIDRIVIAESDRPDPPVFEARSEDHAQIHRFMIHAGSNDVGVLHPSSGTYQTLIPDGRSFVLIPNELYRVTVCKAGKCRSSPFTFR